MIRIFSLIAVPVLLVALSTGCVREIADSPAAGSLVTLRAVVGEDLSDRAGQSNQDTRVGADIDKATGTVAFKWLKGDRIAVQTSKGFEIMELCGEGGEAEGKFTGYLTGATGRIAVYPSSVPLSYSGSVLTMALPAGYSYKSGETNALMAAFVDGEWMRFGHLVSLLNVDVVGVPEGAMLVVTAPGRKISGEFSADLSEDKACIVTSAAKGASESSVTVAFPSAVQLAQVYVPMPVGEYPSLEVKVLDKEGNLIEGSLRQTTRSKTFSRATIKSMPKIEMKLPTLELKQRAYNMEKVTLDYGNIPDGQKVTIDFGDGTQAASVTGSGSLVHKFDNSTGTDRTFTVTLSTNGQTVRKDIFVYSLMALSEVMVRFKDPSCTDVWVMAHRANTADKTIPENSIKGLNACIAAGIQVVETDTRLTSDGQIVICHDESISRTTTGSGNISDLTLSKIRSYRLKDRNGAATTQVMPTLKEFLEAARGKIYVNLDYSPRTASTAQVMAVVQELGMTEQVLLYCNSAAKIAEVAAIDPYAHAYAWYNRYAELKQLPGEHMVQYGYTPDSRPDLGAAVSEGLICTVNMLTGVSDTYIEIAKLNQLLSYFPDVRLIQIDAADKLVAVLKGYPYTNEPMVYFVSPSGSGDRSGSSWENAMGVGQWRSMIETATADKDYSELVALDNSTFHFKEGTYCVPTSEYGIVRMDYPDYGKMCRISILGGYESSSTGTDLSKRDVSANVTIFTGDLNGSGKADSGDAGMFCLDAFAHLKVDGVTFAHSYGKARWDQKAFILNCPTSGARSQLDLTDCRFYDIHGYVDTDTKYHGGSAVWVGKNALATLDKCEISDCHEQSRGAGIRIAESTGAVFLNACSIHDNALNDRFGSAIHVTAGSLLMNNCTMGRNHGSHGVLNGSGNWLIVNSTVVADHISSISGGDMVYRSESSASNSAAILNSMFLFDGYSSVVVNGATYALNSLGYNVTGDNGQYFVPHSTDKTGQTVSGLGLTWNDGGYYTWNGSVSSFAKPSLSTIENAVKTGCNKSSGPYSNLGLEFYNWLQSVGGGRNPLAYDQAGNARNTSQMWPGAYQK